jgi:hypothetical protein
MTINRKIILSAVFTALAVSMGYLFLLIPNVEMISATVFIAGAVVGPVYGLFIGLSAELLFSLLNPMGAAAPPLLIAQLTCFMLIGFVGGLVGLPSKEQLWQKSLFYGLYGLLLTIIYDTLTTLSFAVFIAAKDPNKLVTIFASGITYYATHSLVNTIIFMTIVPAVLFGIRRYQMSKNYA